MTDGQGRYVFAMLFAAHTFAVEKQQAGIVEECSCSGPGGEPAGEEEETAA